MFDITRYASVNADHAAPDTSEKYSFIPTTRVLDVLADSGWLPSKVMETRARKNKGYQKHMVRLRRSSGPMAVGDSIPEILLINSHAGTAAFSFLCGLFELICSNGLVIARESYGAARVTHRGFTEDKVAIALDSTLANFDKVLDSRERMLGIELTRPEQLVFAESVIPLVSNGGKFTARPEDLIAAPIRGQLEPSLWNTYNTIQRNVIEGNVSRTNTQTHRTRRSSAVKNIAKNVALNEALWTLAEKMAELKS